MSYILDALKKSEREKTLGQVPTLESVVSDGAKKQRSGTPWWLNLIVFFVTLIAVVGILNMAGLINFSSSENSASQQTGTSEVSVSGVDMKEPAVEPVVADPETVLSEELLTDLSIQSQQNVTAATHVNQSTANALQAQETPPPQSPDTMQATETQMTDVLSEVSTDVSPTNDAQLGEPENNTAQQAEELAALSQQFEAQKQLEQANSNNANAGRQQAGIEQQSQPQYEEVIHNDLRDISVNVVSYSSDARQRFVMLDLTIYKEGDQLANNAQVMEIIRTGAIVDYQNKRYLLKP